MKRQGPHRGHLEIGVRFSILHLEGDVWGEKQKHLIPLHVCAGSSSISAVQMSASHHCFLIHRSFPSPEVWRVWQEVGKQAIDQRTWCASHALAITVRSLHCTQHCSPYALSGLGHNSAQLCWPEREQWQKYLWFFTCNNFFLRCL